MVVDHRYEQLDRVRELLSLAVYPVQWAVDVPATAGAYIVDFVASRQALIEENRRLRRRQLRTQSRLQRLAALEAENARLRELLDSAEQLERDTAVAEIMRIDLDPFRHQVVINRGTVHHEDIAEAAVTDADGVMGQVMRAGALTSRTLLITDPNHSIPVEVRRNRLRTVAQGTGETNRLSLPYIPNHADIEVGDELVSSGLGGRFPRGYPVAVVTEVEPNPDQRFASVSAEPLAAIGRSREVLLVWSRRRAAEEGDDDAVTPEGSP